MVLPRVKCASLNERHWNSVFLICAKLGSYSMAPTRHCKLIFSLSDVSRGAAVDLIQQQSVRRQNVKPVVLCGFIRSNYQTIIAVSTALASASKWSRFECRVERTVSCARHLGKVSVFSAKIWRLRRFCFFKYTSTNGLELSCLLRLWRHPINRLLELTRARSGSVHDVRIPPNRPEQTRQEIV